MGYFRTILTYHNFGEAEVDKSFLEAEGFTAHLQPIGNS